MGRTRRGIAAGSAGALLAVGIAHAEQSITAEPSNRFTSTAITVQPGEKLTFHNHDVVLHDVTSSQPGADGKPLFETGFVEANRSAEVKRVPDLDPGSYPFLCSLHPEQMKGTLTVAGTPVATPTPTPGGTDTAAPRVAMSGVFRARSIRRRGRVVVGVRSNEPATLRLTARGGRHVLGQAEAKLPKGRRSVVVRVARHARGAVRPGRRLRLVAVATDAAGNARRSVLKVRLP